MKKDKIMLFNGIDEKEIERIMQCLNAYESSYSAGETLIDFSSDTKKFGIVLSGSVSVERTDEHGSRSLLEVAEQGEIFGEGFLFQDVFGDSITAVCGEPCRVLFLSYDQISKRCTKACESHSKLVENLFFLMSQKLLLLNRRLEILSCRGIRAKLMSFFSLCSAQRGSVSFELPFSVTAMADYLCVDRSAMVREMKHMRQEGLIENSGRQITLLKS